MLTFTLARWRSVASSVGHEIRIHCSCLARQSIYPTWSAASDFHEWKQVHLPDESPVAREPTAAGSDDTQQLDSQRRRGVLRTRATEALKGVVHNGDVSVREDFEFSSYRKLELLQRLRQMGRRLEWRAALKSFRRARSKGLIADDLMYRFEFNAAPSVRVLTLLLLQESYLFISQACEHNRTVPVAILCIFLYIS